MLKAHAVLSISGPGVSLYNKMLTIREQCFKPSWIFSAVLWGSPKHSDTP